ncbi:uncharacterized protein C19orf44 homolog isoform X2 [Brachyhypopomus gauderio]|uniref:uncharacterized protein C19orf44 homolog isoform X2 n=1 Tax=Brachyhypopomus gauderio TaxID=698409 RepID=UPI004042063F
MWSRGGIRSTALERAQAQLSGHRPVRSGTDKSNRPDLANFGNGLLQTRQTLFQDLSDVSLDDPESEFKDHLTDPPKLAPRFAQPSERVDVGGGGRFLKKTTDGATAHRQSSGTADTRDLKVIPWHRSQSVALSRLAIIEDRFRNHKNKKLGLNAETEIPPAHKSDTSALSSSDLSMAGSRFLKKKVMTAQELKGPDTTPVETYRTPGNIASRVEKEASLEKDEDDVRKLLGESLNLPNGNWKKVMRQTETSPPVAVKTYRSVVPSAEKDEELFPASEAFKDHLESLSLSLPSSPKTTFPSRPAFQRAGLTRLSLSSSSGHSEIRSLDELFPASDNDDNDDTLTEKSVISDDFQLNVMTLDDLAPVSLGSAEIPKEKVEASPSVSGHPSVSSAEDICEETPVEYQSDFESEIHEAETSANEISERLSGRDGHSSLASEPQPVSHESRDDQHTPSEELTSGRYSGGDGSHSGFHTSDAIITHGELQSPTARRSMKDATVQTQTDPTHTWPYERPVLGPSLGMSYTDPTPVASHTVSAEAVEVLSTYSPAVFALNDLLRQQLALTRSFIESSRHQHQAVVESLGPADYRYTTLEETREFIRSNRSPRLTVEDALTEVLQEMRDYHYI